MEDQDLLKEIKEDVKDIKKDLNTFKVAMEARIVKLEVKQNFYAISFGFIGGLIYALVDFFISKGGN